MFYYLYKTTNTINGKFYIGVHKTEDLDDEYLGSGSSIRKAIEKYGKEVFIKEILEFFNNSEEMYLKEKEIVNEEFLSRNEVYNIRVGGDGGFDHINRNKEFYVDKHILWWDTLSQEEKEFINKKKGLPGKSNPMYGVRRCGEENPFFGKELSKESKAKIAEANKGKVIVKDAITNEIIGAVDVNHEKYISGEWVSINKGKKASQETKNKLSKIKKESGVIPPSCKGLLHWNNGSICVRSKTCPGEEWKRGRLPFKNKK